MNPLIDRIAEAREKAATREGDIRIQEFLRTMTIQPVANTGVPSSVSITCENRYWTRYLTPEAIESLEALSAEGLASAMAGWIQGAFKNGLLSISNSPHAARS